ncbi:MAG: hypothetical protein AB1690_02470 [Candidatus Zixiibacteriota bacterium]
MPEELMPKYVLANYDAQYFAELLAYGDAQILPEEAFLPDDTAEDFKRKLALQHRKKVLQLSRARAIAEGIKQPWFRLLEGGLLARIRRIESVEIWEAKRKGEGTTEAALTMEHEGIIRFFNSYAQINRTVAEIERSLEELKNKADRPDDLDVEAKLT